MVQIIPARDTSFTDKILSDLGENLGQGFGNLIRGPQQMREKEALSKLGIDPRIRDPKVIAELLKQSGKSREKEKTREFVKDILEGGQKKDLSDMGAQKNNVFNLSDQQIAAITVEDPTVGKALLEAKKSKLKEKERTETAFQKEREYHTQFTKPVIEGANKTLEAITSRKGLMRQWKSDISSGNTEGVKQFLAEKSGLNFWLNPESARAKTAAKEYFVEGLSTLSPGTRPNMFIETQLASAMPQVGHTKEAGLTMLEMQDYLDDLKEQKAREVLRLAEEDVEKHGFEQKDLNTRAQKNIETYATERQNQLAYNIRKIHEDNRSDEELANEVVLKKIPNGSPLTERMMSVLMLKNNDDVDAAIRDAINLGFDLPKKKNE